MLPVMLKTLWATAVLLAFLDCPMDAKSAVQIMYADEIEKADDASVIINEKTKEYNELQSNVMSAAARGYVDSIIEPVDTRKYVIGAFEMLYTKYENRPGKKHGTV